MKNLKGKLTIGNVSTNDGIGYIEIRLECVNSSIEFVRVKISHEEMMRALCSQAFRPVEFDLSGIENVGKRQEQKDLVFKMPNTTYGSRKEIAEQEAQKHADKGWIASRYFGSQSSFFTNTEGTFAKTLQYRYVVDKT